MMGGRGDPNNYYSHAMNDRLGNFSGRGMGRGGMGQPRGMPGQGKRRNNPPRRNNPGNNTAQPRSTKPGGIGSFIKDDGQ